MRRLSVLAVLLGAVLADSCSLIPAFKGNQTLDDTVLHTPAYSYFYYTSYGPFSVQLLSSVSGFDLFISKDNMRPTADSAEVQYSSQTSPMGLYLEVNASDTESQCWAVGVYSSDIVQSGSRFDLTFYSRFDTLLGECKRMHSEIEIEYTDTSMDLYEQTVPYNDYVYYYFSAKPNHKVTVKLLPETGDPDLYMSQSSFSLYPTSINTEHQWPSSSMGSTDSLSLNTGSVPECYAIGVYGYTESKFTLTIISEKLEKDVNWVLITLSICIPVFALMMSGLLIWKRFYNIKEIHEIKGDAEMGETEATPAAAKGTEPSATATPSLAVKNNI